MSFQECPKCEGLGYINPFGISDRTRIACPVCRGSMIISELTGLPPKQ